MQMVVKSHKQAIVLCDTIITTQGFINKCAAPFEEIMDEKARKVRVKHSSVFGYRVGCILSPGRVVSP